MNYETRNWEQVNREIRNWEMRMVYEIDREIRDWDQNDREIRDWEILKISYCTSELEQMHW
jgi:hypothetical protein